MFYHKDHSYVAAPLLKLPIHQIMQLMKDIVWMLFLIPKVIDQANVFPFHPVLIS